MTAPERRAERQAECQAERRAGRRTGPDAPPRIRTVPPALLLVGGEAGGERTGADLIALARAARRPAHREATNSPVAGVAQTADGADRA